MSRSRKVLSIFAGLFLCTLATSGCSLPTIVGNRDWSAATNDVLGQSNINTGDVVGFWQAYLVSYDMVPCAGGLDGRFGPASASATAALQRFFGVPATGVVDTATWRASSGWLRPASPSGSNPSYWSPLGAQQNVALYAYPLGGAWTWESDGTSSFEQSFGTGYPDISFSPSTAC